MIFFTKNSSQNSLHISPPLYVLCAPLNSFFLTWSPEKVWYNMQMTKFLIMLVSSLLCDLLTLRLKYFSHRHILRQLQLPFLPQCER